MHQECVKNVTRQKFELETLNAVQSHVNLLENYGLRFEIMHIFFHPQHHCSELYFRTDD